MKQAQPIGRRAVDFGEKAMAVLQKAQANFEQAQQEVMQPQTDLEMLMQEAPLPVMPVPQVNVCVVKTLEALTGIVENIWNPDAGQPAPDTLNPGVEANYSELFAGPKVVSASHDESHRHGTFGVVATCMCDHPSIGKFLRYCITFLCIVAWACSSTHPLRHWPACFDQTCGYPGEGPLTTLDSPGVPGMSLTPTQEIMTCDMIRRKTKEKRGPHEICRACGSTLARRHNGLKCRKCRAWTMQRGMRKGCCGFTLLPHVRRCFA